MFSDQEASNLGLNYSCKLAGCTFNVQPANLYKKFFRRKACYVSGSYEKCTAKHSIIEDFNVLYR